MPEDRIKDVIYFAPFDMENPISFNIMEDVGMEKRHLVVNGLMSVFEKIWEDAWSARMAYILQNTLLALLEYPGATLLAVNRMYTDKEFRNKVVDNVTDISVKSFWVDEYAKYTDKYAQEATPAIQNKIGQFAGNPLIRNIIGQPKSSFDLRKIMDEKKIMIVNLSKGRVGEGNARLLGSMLITKLYLAAMSRADESASNLAKLPQFYLYVDEFQSFADKSFADILSEARKYKLNLTIAHQYIEQMEEEVRDAVFGNAGTMISFRVGAYDAEVLEKEFAPVLTAEDIVNLGKYQIYLKLMIDGASSAPFSATALPPIPPPEKSFVDEIIKSSREKFSKLRPEVEESIVEWHGLDKSTPPPAHKSSKSYPPRKDDSRPIDIRGKKEDKPILYPKKEPEEKPKEENFEAVSLSSLKEKNNNQRKPGAKNISDLRNALNAVVSKNSNNELNKKVKEEAKKEEFKVESMPKPLDPNPKPLAPNSIGPTPEELKKILNES